MKEAGEDFLKPSFSSATAQSNPRPIQTPAEEISMKKPGVSRQITLEELKAQDKQKPWFVVKGEVYDGTAFLNEHPGGGDSILLVAGEDATDDFMAIHSPEGRAKLAEVSFHSKHHVCHPAKLVLVSYWNTCLWRICNG